MYCTLPVGYGLSPRLRLVIGTTVRDHHTDLGASLRVTCNYNCNQCATVI